MLSIFTQDYKGLDNVWYKARSTAFIGKRFAWIPCRNHRGAFTRYVNLLLSLLSLLLELSCSSKLKDSIIQLNLIRRNMKLSHGTISSLEGKCNTSIITCEEQGKALVPNSSLYVFPTRKVGSIFHAPTSHSSRINTHDHFFSDQRKAITMLTLHFYLLSFTQPSKNLSSCKFSCKVLYHVDSISCHSLLITCHVMRTSNYKKIFYMSDMWDPFLFSSSSIFNYCLFHLSYFIDIVNSGVKIYNHNVSFSAVFHYLHSLFQGLVTLLFQTL